MVSDPPLPFPLLPLVLMAIELCGVPSLSASTYEILNVFLASPSCLLACPEEAREPVPLMPVPLVVPEVLGFTGLGLVNSLRGDTNFLEAPSLDTRGLTGTDLCGEDLVLGTCFLCWLGSVLESLLLIAVPLELCGEYVPFFDNLPLSLLVSSFLGVLAFLGLNGPLLLLP